MSKLAVFAIVTLVLVILIVAWAAKRGPEPVKLIPTLTGNPEYCLTCHDDLPEISEAHPIHAFGCVICHGGEPLALEAELAHSTLRGGRNPSDLAVVDESCGGEKCHSGSMEDQSDHTHRVLTNLHGIYVGAITNERLTGCAACHTPTVEKNQDEPQHHLTTAISYTQCNTCHNQGSYDINTMAFNPHQAAPDDRYEAYYPPNTQDARCEWTLDCIDCHTRMEAMGDGDIHSQMEETQSIRCRTCHGTIEESPQTRRISSKDDLAIRLAFLNRSAGETWSLKPGDIILSTSQGESLWNTRLLSDGTYELFGKVTGQIFTFRPVKGTACQQKIDQQDSKYCHTCHQE